MTPPNERFKACYTDKPFPVSFNFPASLQQRRFRLQRAVALVTPTPPPYVPITYTKASIVRVFASTRAPTYQTTCPVRQSCATSTVQAPESRDLEECEATSVKDMSQKTPKHKTFWTCIYRTESDTF